VRLNLSWISFVRCVKEIFLVLIQHSPETRPKRNFKCWFKQKKKFKARDDFFTQKHTHHVFVVRLHTHLNTRAERERERGDDDADDDGAYYYYYFDAFR